MTCIDEAVLRNNRPAVSSNASAAKEVRSESALERNGASGGRVPTYGCTAEERSFTSLRNLHGMVDASCSSNSAQTARNPLPPTATNEECIDFTGRTLKVLCDVNVGGSPEGIVSDERPPRELDDDRSHNLRPHLVLEVRVPTETIYVPAAQCSKDT